MSDDGYRFFVKEFEDGTPMFEDDLPKWLSRNSDREEDGGFIFADGTSSYCVVKHTGFSNSEPDVYVRVVGAKIVPPVLGNGVPPRVMAALNDRRYEPRGADDEAIKESGIERVL